MANVLTTIAAALFLIAPLPPVQAGYSTVVRSVRAIQDESFRNICTATSINQSKQLWLTAGHCVGESPIFIAGHPAEPVFKDKDADLAVLHTTDYPVTALKLRQTRPSVEQRIKIVGHPLGLFSIQVFNGQISSLRTMVEGTPYMLFDMTACGGNSGSAVVDEDDRVLSVLQIGFGQGCSSFSGGAPWEVVARLVGKFFRA